MQSNLQRSKGRVFWREMGPTAHACQLYQSHDELIETLTAFIGGGLWAGEAAVVIARDATLKELEAQLRQSSLDLAHFRGDETYVSLDADATLARFMVDGWPDATLFNEVASAIVARARRNGRNVRAYGEMVAVLWQNAQYDAAIRLEYLWNQFLEREQLRLLCAYQRDSFERASIDHRDGILDEHTLFQMG